MTIFSRNKFDKRRSDRDYIVRINERGIEMKRTPNRSAIRHIPAVAAFIAALLIIFLVNSLFSTTIWDAARYGDISELSNQINRLGVNINARDSEGDTPLLEALRYSNNEIAFFLIKKRGADSRE